MENEHLELSGLFRDGVRFMTLAAQSLLQDEFTKCFQPLPDNTSWAMFWESFFGIVVRYLVLFPCRLAFLLVSSGILLSLLCIVSHLRLNDQKKWIFLVLSKCWAWSIAAEIRHHGQKPILREPHIFVSNHTSYIDFILLSSYKLPHAIVAQTHQGFFGYVQRNILTFMGSLSFHRDEKRDRLLMTRKILAHTKSIDSPPILVFPEGTCVNNEYTVLFHKGVFELGVKICPVAIKYDKRFLDPYWNTRESSFLQHGFYLMTRWKLVVDIWWIDPQPILPRETSIEFANRIKSLISDRAGLENLSWDGYLKNFTSSLQQLRLLRKSQESYAKALRKRIQAFGSGEKSLPESPAIGSPEARTMDFPDWIPDNALVTIKNELIKESLKEI